MDAGEMEMRFGHLLEELQSSIENEDVDDSFSYGCNNGSGCVIDNTVEEDECETVEENFFSDLITEAGVSHFHLCDNNSKDCSRKIPFDRPDKKKKYSSMCNDSQDNRKLLKISLPDISLFDLAYEPKQCLKLIYEPGSLVWAKVRGYPLWPAMIDVDPDYNTFFFVDELIHRIQYHAVFFDADNRLSRFWCSTDQLKPFEEPLKLPMINTVSLMNRFKTSVKEARKASLLNRKNRLKKYNFKMRLHSPETKLCED